MSLTKTNADMYADDSTLTAPAKTVTELEEKQNIDASIMSDWCRVYQMADNATKTNVMLITL